MEVLLNVLTALLCFPYLFWAVWTGKDCLWYWVNMWPSSGGTSGGHMGLSHSSYFRDFCFEKGRQLDLGILRI